MKPSFFVHSIELIAPRATNKIKKCEDSVRARSIEIMSHSNELDNKENTRDSQIPFCGMEFIELLF